MFTTRKVEMTPEQYQELLVSTAPPSGHVAVVSQRLGDKAHTELLHAQLGITTEAGEFADAIKKYLFYGRAIDRINLIEELGDLTWYIGLAIQAIDSTWGEVFKANIKKLAARYPERFTEYHALNRNLEREREILEEKS
jgi:NTP pyrophosphatase (non-canonical NTP hydrolase)